MKKTDNKKKEIVSLLSMLGIALACFIIVGLMLNWNLFIVIGCFIPILLIGLMVIIAPNYLKKTHKNLSTKIDKGITSYAKKLSK